MKNPPYTDLGDGIRHYPHYLQDDTQKELAQDILPRAESLWLSPVTPGGQPFSVRQMNFGPLGWVSDRQGYRYQSHHPETGTPWPDIPPIMLQLWTELLPGTPPPECCLVNHYQDTAKMGLHRDADEEDQETPILSVSLGAPARFRIGGRKRGGPTRSVILQTGDVIILGGPSRRFHHGIDRLLPADDLFAPALGFDGRLNLTLRRVTRSTKESQ